MSEHPQIQEQLALYPTLDRPARQSLEQHLSTCPDCTETLATYLEMDQALHRFVDNKLRYLATKPIQPPFMAGKHCPDELMAGQAVGSPPVAWPKSWLHVLPQPRTFVLQLAGAGVLIVLLVALSLLFTAWNPAQEHQIASTPTYEYPLATATPQLYGDWRMPVVAQQQTATPLATVSLEGAPADAPPIVQQPDRLFALRGLATYESPLLMEIDKAKITPLMPAMMLIAQRKVDLTYTAQILSAT
ncbi:MAG: hypothetical protein NT075_06470 [Chloroflexi bacterium]|nr:hypothetical protein [Chloroflexota bacterium]